MVLTDTAGLRDILTSTYPGFIITDVALPSGQRVVYFGRFSDFSRQEAEEEKFYSWSEWGETAVKISNASSSHSIARIQSEIDALNSINSRYYPKLFHSEVLSFHPDTEDPLQPKLFITIEEKVESLPLSACVSAYANERKVTELLLELIQALKLLWNHDKAYVHRDVKPENILIKPNGEIVVIDLGIIREAGQQGITLTSAPCGPCTPVFASPEQLKNDKRNINYKSDLYSLGVLVYTILAQRNPFSLDDDFVGIEDVVNNVLNFEPKPLSELGLCSVRLSGIVEKLMNKDPYKRYRRVETLEQQLTEILRG